MKCLKCGKETSHEQVFCDHCLDAMAAYPVKPGTHIHLPQKAGDTPVKKAPSRKRVLSADEQLLRFKKLSGWLVGVIAVLIIALGLTAYSLVMTGQALEQAKQAGRNFSVDTTME